MKETMLIQERFSLKDKELVVDFYGLLQNPEAIQQQLLQEILKTNADTVVGKKYNFSKIKNSSEYVKKVPVHEWSDLEKLSKKMEEGAVDQLFSGKPIYFIVTSGTTGSSKFIPESKLGAMAKSITSRLRNALVISKHPASIVGKIFPISNSAGVGKVACGIPYGYASGITLMETPEENRKKIAFPLELLNIQTPEILDYAVMRFAIEQNVSAIVGNNSGRMGQLIVLGKEHAEQIITDIAEGTFTVSPEHVEALPESITLHPNPGRAEELRAIFRSGEPFTPASYWPNLTVFTSWMGGSIGRYLAAVKPLLGKNIAYFDFGYGASEGKFNIPLEVDQPAGVLSLLAAFYEFEDLDEEGAISLAHELVDGKQYKMIITTFSGLYRYNLNDIIEVRGFTGNTPNIIFVSKTKDVGNICGEKLSASFIADAVQTVSAQHNLSVKHFCAIPNAEKKQYQFCIEFMEDNVPPKSFLHELDTKLAEHSIYATKRRQELLLPPIVVIMKKHWQDALYAEKAGGNASTAQIKLPVIYENVPCPEYLHKELY